MLRDDQLLCLSSASHENRDAHMQGAIEFNTYASVGMEMNYRCVDFLLILS